MNTIVYDQNLGSLSVPDGLLIDVMTSQASSLTPGSINEVDYVGTSTWGQFNAIQSVSTPQDILQKLGSPQVRANDLATFAKIALAAGVQTVKCVRVGSGTQVAAILPVAGASSAIVNLTGLYAGTRPNAATATLTYSPGTPASMQTTGPNNAKVYVDLTIQIPNATPEVYQNLDGNLKTGATYSLDPTTLGNAIVAAVNTGIQNGRPASQFFVASLGASIATAGAPVMNTANAVTTLGSDGLDFGGANTALDAAMLGSATASPPTGMQAFSGHCSGGVIALLGNSDVSTIAGQLLAFAKAQNAHAVFAFPDGTPRTGAGSSTDLLAQYGIKDWAITPFHGEWCEIVDADNGAIHRFVDPAALGAIRMAITAPPDSPANKEFPFVVGTSKLRSDGTVYVPVGAGDALAMENGGVNYWTNDTSGAVGFAIAHNKNSLGKTAGAKGNIAYGRNLQFAIKTFNSPVVGAIVGGDQGYSSSDDSQRKAARALFNGIIAVWQRDGVFDGDVPRVVCDLTNNSPGRGMLRVDVYLQQREIIDVVAVGLMSGVGPLIAVNPTPSR